MAPGAVGELIVRTDRPWAMNHGYYKNPEATARGVAQRLVPYRRRLPRRTRTGNFFFVDRMKDAIRRRGENISSFEVETELCAHPAVQARRRPSPCPSEFGEDEVLAAVSLVEGATLDPAELIAFLTPRMAHFMVPRYVRIVPELPKTPTQKVQKHLLRTEASPPTPGTARRPASASSASASPPDHRFPPWRSRRGGASVLSHFVRKDFLSATEGSWAAPTLWPMTPPSA